MSSATAPPAVPSTDATTNEAPQLRAFVFALFFLVSSQTTGDASGYALLSIGLFNSIMFPTIFSLACEGLGRHAAEGSGVICMEIVGGAIVPPLTGYAADLLGLRLALLVPALCYVVILAFGWYARRPHRAGTLREE